MTRTGLSRFAIGDHGVMVRAMLALIATGQSLSFRGGRAFNIPFSAWWSRQT